MQNVKKWPIVWRVLLFWVGELCVAELFVSRIAHYLPLPHTAQLVVYKCVALAIILGLNYLLLGQRLFATTLKPATYVILFAIWVAFAGIAVSGGKADRIPYAVLIGVIAAVTEEISFRGIIFGSLLASWRGRYARTRAIVLSAALFSGMHLINLVHQNAFQTGIQMLQVFGLGVLLAALYLRSGSLLAPMAFHFSLDYTATLIHGATGMTSVQSTSVVIGSIFWCAIYIAIGMAVAGGTGAGNKLLQKLKMAPSK